MLQPVTHIEGAEHLIQEKELNDDTHPLATRVRFDVVPEEMPALSANEGQIVMKNFIHITKTAHLGALIVIRRIKDQVAFDEAAGKWKVTKWAKISDIQKYPDEWNAFARGSSGDVVGTPLSILFKNDPARAETYKYRHIFTIEQLAAVTDGDTQELGMGGRSDRERARAYLAKISERAPMIQISSKLEEKDRQIESLQSQLAGLTEKLTQMLTEEVKPKARRGRPPLKKQTESVEASL